MLRQQAFIKKNKMLKGALHVHTNRSDGIYTPEETIKKYKEKGFDFMSITDHRIYNFKNFAPETGMTVIPGVENESVGIRYETRGGYTCFHIVAIGPSKEDGNGYEHDEDTGRADVRSSEQYQPYLDEMHRRNNLTIYCHPEWSSTPARLFETQKGHFAMEIFNSGSAISDDDTDAAYWDEILDRGNRWYGVATDDMHNDSYLGLGWVMVNAENNINAILEALKNGEFYSSCGPEIYDFYVEDGKAIIDCSPVAKVRLHSMNHPKRVTRDANGNITHAEFDLANAWPTGYEYVRISIVDKDGKKAWTNPIFFDNGEFPRK